MIDPFLSRTVFLTGKFLLKRQQVFAGLNVFAIAEMRSEEIKYFVQSDKNVIIFRKCAFPISKGGNDDL